MNLALEHFLKREPGLRLGHADLTMVVCEHAYKQEVITRESRSYSDLRWAQICSVVRNSPTDCCSLCWMLTMWKCLFKPVVQREGECTKSVKHKKSVHPRRVTNRYSCFRNHIYVVSSK